MRDLSDAKIIAVRKLNFNSPWAIRSRENKDSNYFHLPENPMLVSESVEYYEGATDLFVVVLERFPAPTFKELTKDASIVSFRSHNNTTYVAQRYSGDSWELTGVNEVKSTLYLEWFADLDTIEVIR